MNVKKFVVYYNTNRELIGYREHHFDWEKGDEIMTDGVRTRICGVFNGTKKNMSLIREMFATLRRHMPKQKVVRVLDEGFERTGDQFEDFMNAMLHSHFELVDVRRQVWKSFDSQLSFVDQVLASME